MIYKTKEIKLKNGKKAIFRAPTKRDAAEMNRYLKTIAGETPFILLYPEECNGTVKQEEDYLKNLNESDCNVMIVAEVDGEIAGNCQVVFNNKLKTKHRANVAIGLYQKFWV